MVVIRIPGWMDIMFVEQDGPTADSPRPTQATAAPLSKPETGARRMALRVSTAAAAAFDHAALQRPRCVARMARDWGGRAAWGVMHDVMTQVWRACDGPPAVGSFASLPGDDAPPSAELALELPFDVALTSTTLATPVEAVHIQAAGSSALRLPLELALIDRAPLIDARAAVELSHHPAAVRLDADLGLDRVTDSFDWATDSKRTQLLPTPPE
jgi:hypothetical protein